MRGAYALYSFNTGNGDDDDIVNSASGRYARFNQRLSDTQIDVFLLDQRYERDVIPCDKRRQYCELVVLPHNALPEYHNMINWCLDFLYGEGDVEGPQGSCCLADEQVYFGWCLRPSSRQSEYFQEACNVSAPTFGRRSLVLLNDSLIPPTGFSVGEDVYQDTAFCDLLGREQRQWLRTQVAASKAALKIFVSPSVLIANTHNNFCGTTPTGTEISCPCSADDVGCYQVAQRELLHVISSASGCSVVVTGDFHFSDIKKLEPGKQRYSDFFDSEKLSQPIYQVMASGMTTSTGKNYSCDSYRLDPDGLRTHPE